MKSDYFEGMADTLDLLVVGGYFGRSNWASGKGDFDGIGVFLLAAASKVDHKNP